MSTQLLHHRVADAITVAIDTGTPVREHLSNVFLHDIEALEYCDCLQRIGGNQRPFDD